MRTTQNKQNQPLKKRWLKRLILWSLVSLLWQLPLYYAFDKRVQQVISPVLTPKTTTAKPLGLVLPGHYHIKQPKISTDDTLLAFREGAQLMIYDLLKQKVVWQRDTYPKGSFLAYQWLPDRNSLLLFLSGTGVNPLNPHHFEVGIHVLEFDSTSGQLQDRFTNSLPTSFQYQGINNIALSTSTNLLYFSGQEKFQTHLFEIDIMKHLRSLTYSNENILGFAISSADGKIYFTVTKQGRNETFTLKNSLRRRIQANSDEVVLGFWNHKLFLGTIRAGHLLRIRTLQEDQLTLSQSEPALFWQGNLPWNSNPSIAISGYDLLISTNNALYKVSPQQTAKIPNSGSVLFASTGKYVWNVTSTSSGTVLKKILF